MWQIAYVKHLLWRGNIVCDLPLGEDLVHNCAKDIKGEVTSELSSSDGNLKHGINCFSLPSQVMQDFNQQLFLQENPVFHKAQVFHFQPSDSDMVGFLFCGVFIFSKDLALTNKSACR